jgi:hypothetical protein
MYSRQRRRDNRREAAADRRRDLKPAARRRYSVLGAEQFGKIRRFRREHQPVSEIQGDRHGQEDDLRRLHVEQPEQRKGEKDRERTPKK